MVIIHSSTRFKRLWKKLPESIKKDFEKQIEVFQKYPFHPNLRTHKLKGSLDDYYSFYLRDGYRVLFDFIEADVVLLMNIGSHNDYKKWERY